jgi:hypothetical protein
MNCQAPADRRGIVCVPGEPQMQLSTSGKEARIVLLDPIEQFASGVINLDARPLWAGAPRRIGSSIGQLQSAGLGRLPRLLRCARSVLEYATRAKSVRGLDLSEAAQKKPRSAEALSLGEDHFDLALDHQRLYCEIPLSEGSLQECSDLVATLPVADRTHGIEGGGPGRQRRTPLDLSPGLTTGRPLGDARPRPDAVRKSRETDA